MKTSARKLLAVAILVILFAALPSETALAATLGDANADSGLSVLDVFYLINTLFYPEARRFRSAGPTRTTTAW